MHNRYAPPGVLHASYMQLINTAMTQNEWNIMIDVHFLVHSLYFQEDANSFLVTFSHFLWYHSLQQQHWIILPTRGIRQLQEIWIVSYATNEHSYSDARDRKGDIWPFSRQLTKWLLILLTQYWIQLISSLKQRLVVAYAIAYTPQSELLVCCSTSINLTTTASLVEEHHSTNLINITLWQWLVKAVINIDCLCWQVNSRYYPPMVFTIVQYLDELTSKNIKQQPSS